MTKQTEQTEPTWTVEGSSADFGDSLRGKEEQEIALQFGRPLQTLGDVDPSMGLRALVFVHRLREGDKTRQAYEAAMDLTRVEVMTYFQYVGPNPEEVDDEDPVTDQGKDG
jgi:hypothetical protein